MTFYVTASIFSLLVSTLGFFLFCYVCMIEKSVSPKTFLAFGIACFSEFICVVFNDYMLETKASLIVHAVIFFAFLFIKLKIISQAIRDRKEKAAT